MVPTPRIVQTKMRTAVLDFNDGTLFGEVVSHHLTPGSFVAALRTFSNREKVSYQL
jgi:hypothetical protein